MNFPTQDLANQLVTLYQLYQTMGDSLSDEQKQKLVDEAFNLVMEEPERDSGLIVPEVITPVIDIKRGK